MWVGIIQSVEGLQRKKIDIPQERENLVSRLYSRVAISSPSWVSSRHLPCRSFAIHTHKQAHALTHPIRSVSQENPNTLHDSINFPHFSDLSVKEGVRERGREIDVFCICLLVILYLPL